MSENVHTGSRIINDNKSVKQFYKKDDYKNKQKFVSNTVRKSYNTVSGGVDNIQHDFANFIIEFNIIGLTAGVILGTVGNNTIKSIIDNMIMPLIAPLFGSKGEWEDKTVKFGDVELRVGKFVGDIIYFLFVFLITFGFLNYFFAKVIMGRSSVADLSKKWRFTKGNGTTVRMV
jgi:large-conductance mechanosensitive channel